MITQDMINLYDQYTHEKLDRRDFMEKLTSLAGSTAAAMTILPLLAADTAAAAIIEEDDERLLVSDLLIDTPEGDLKGYLARPKSAGDTLPSVVIIHENRGLNPHIKDVTRRMALAGFNAIAPDFLSPRGGTPENEDLARTMIRSLEADRTEMMNFSVARMMARHPLGNGKVGVLGFCWGGAQANLAARSEHVSATVAFYGRVLSVEQVPDVSARMMLHYAALDTRINAGIPDFREALDAHGVDYTLHMYDDVNHAFHNDTSAARYNAVAAKLAWERSTKFLRDTLTED